MPSKYSYVNEIHHYNLCHVTRSLKNVLWTPRKTDWLFDHKKSLLSVTATRNIDINANDSHLSHTAFETDLHRVPDLHKERLQLGLVHLKEGSVGVSVIILQRSHHVLSPEPSSRVDFAELSIMCTKQ